MDSVASQTYRDFEYIIIDGASTDGTLELINARSPEVDQFISEPDTGIYNAMNKGLRLARGTYLCFMNAGDTFHAPDTLMQLFSSLGNQKPDILYGETNLVNSEGEFLKPRRLKAPKRLNKRSFLTGMHVCHQSFYPKRELAPEYDEHYRFSSDYDWCLKILDKAEVTYNSGLILTDYLSEGVTTRHRKASLIERYKIMCRHFGWYRAILAHFYIVLRALVR